MPRAAALLLFLFSVIALSGTSYAAPSVSLTVSPQTVYSGFATTFDAIPSGGAGNPPSYTYTWTVPSGLTAFPGSCVSSSSTCMVAGTVTQSTPFTVSVFVADSTGATSSSASATATVNPYKCILGASGDLGSCIANSIPLASMGILLSIVLVAITFMLGETLKLEGYQGWYKTEIWETTKSALLLGMALSLLVIISNISSSFAAVTVTAQGTQLAPAAPCRSSSMLSTNLCMLYQNVYSAYLVPQLGQAYKSFSALYGLSIGVGAVKSILISTWLPIPILPPPLPTFMSVQFGSDNANLFKSNYLEPLSPTAAFSFIKDMMSIIVTPIVLLFQFQYDMMPVIVILGIVIFMPIGIILRAIPFLRPIGGTMIALGITLSLVYPTLLLTLNMPITNYFSYLFGAMQANSPGSCSGLWNGIICGIEGAFASVITAGPAAFGILSMVIGPANAFSNIEFFTQGMNVGVYQSFNSIFPALNLIIATTSDMLLQFILAILDIIIGFTIANAIARPLGGRVKLGIGKLRLA